MANQLQQQQVTGLNKAAAFNVYANLCEVHGYSRVTALKDDELNYIYFEADRYGLAGTGGQSVEFILPVDERDSGFDLVLVQKFVAKLNAKEEPPLISKIKLGIVSTDLMAIYYDLSVGLDSPHTDQQLAKAN